MRFLLYTGKSLRQIKGSEGGEGGRTGGGRGARERLVLVYKCCRRYVGVETLKNGG